MADAPAAAAASSTATDAAARPWIKAPVIMLEWEELTAPTTSPALLAKLEAAYGYDGLGILAVRGVPGYVPARAAALPQAHAFGSLPEAVKAKYVDEASTYSFGWSHGKERLEGGRLDTAKGSYYNNPVHDAPFAHDAAVVAAHPSFASPNIWPDEADAPGFTGAYKALARLIVDAGAQLARHVDAYVASVEPAYPPQPGLALADVVSRCRTHKARLLYYFPTDGVETGDGSDVSSWCGCVAVTAAWRMWRGGWGACRSHLAPTTFPLLPDTYHCSFHNDHGSLTGLCSAMYFDTATGQQVPCPDPDAGLFIRSRSGQLVHVAVPADALAFQIGETAQVHSGGVLLATPHCVRAAMGPGAAGVARGTMAVFMEPEPAHAMACPGMRPGQRTADVLGWAEAQGEGDAGVAAADGGASPASAAAWARVLRGARGELLPRGVPTLASRWDGPHQTFGEFTTKTLAAYY